MPAINPYIRFAGRSREALAFYQTIFGGQFDIMSVKDSFSAGKMPAEMDDMVFHSSLYGGGFHMMASDLTDPEGIQMGNAISLTLVCESEDEIREYYEILKADAAIRFELHESEWGGLFAQLHDRFGVDWMLEYSPKQA